MKKTKSKLQPDVAHKILEGIVEPGGTFKPASLPPSTSLEISSSIREIQTKREVTEMIKPLINGFSENSIQTAKLQIDYNELAARVQSLEIVFNAGQGKNFIYDQLMNKLAKEVS